MSRIPVAGVALSLVKVSKRYGADPILEDLSFGLLQGEKVGLIGRNGAGKTTLFRLISGEEAPDEGQVILTQGLRVARLSQNPHFPEGATVRTALEWALADHQALIQRHRELLAQLQHVSKNMEEALHDELDLVEHHLHRMGWDLEPRLKEACTSWGLDDLEAEVEALSGGWRKRVALAQAWLRDPDLLVLDEPTNHLDPDQVERLQAWLQTFDGALLLITHDRHLLDAVVTRMLELEGGRVTAYDGSYSDYLLEKADREFREARLTEHMQNRLRREMAWLARGAKARTRKSKLRIEDALNLKDDVQARTRPGHKLELAFQGGGTRSDALLTAEQVAFAYEGGPELVGSFDLVIQKGMRVALLGPNGCGKSTLLKLLLGDLQASGGRIVRHARLRVSAISQGREELDLGASILDNLSDGSSLVKFGDQTVQAHVYLARFGFPVDHQQRPASSLSGGERNRLLLAKAMLRPADLLVLDEPTNDLDIPTLQNLEEALSEYPGALLLVSHDRFFLDQVCTHTIAWNEGGSPTWELYEGSPATVRSLRAERAAEAASAAKAEAVKASPKPAAPKSRKAGLSQKEQRRLAEVEAALAQLEERIAEQDAILQDPLAFASADAPGHQAMQSREELKAQVEALEQEWMELEEKRGEA